MFGEGKDVETEGIKCCEVGIDEWLSLGTDDGISVNNIDGAKDSLREGCKEGSIVGSDEELCDGWTDGK